MKTDTSFSALKFEFMKTGIWFISLMAPTALFSMFTDEATLYPIQEFNLLHYKITMELRILFFFSLREK